MSKSIKVLTILNDGTVGGIETLCLEAARYTKHDTTYLILWKGGKISEEMLSRGYRVKILNTSIAKYLKDSIKVARICQKEKFDVVLCQGTNPLTALCTVMIHMLCKNTRIIGYVHSSPDDWGMKTRISANIVFKYAKKVICISDFVLNSTKKYIGFEDKLVRIYNGVDTTKFIPRNAQNGKKASKLIYVGRLSEKKGVQVILNALVQVHTDYQLDIIGDGDYRSNLEEYAKSLGLDKKVRFLGNQLDVQRFLSGADIFIHVPTLEEGFGLSVVEAMAAGLLCICSKSGALPEILEDGVTGYLVDKNAPEELAQVIQTSLENYDSKEIREIKNNARNKAREYSINTYVAELDGLVNEISERGGKTNLCR